MITLNAGVLLSLGLVSGSISARNSTMEPGHP